MLLLLITVALCQDTDVTVEDTDTPVEVTVEDIVEKAVEVTVEDIVEKAVEAAEQAEITNDILDRLVIALEEKLVAEEAAEEAADIDWDDVGPPLILID